MLGRGSVVVALMLAAASEPVTAQWEVGVQLGSSHYRGTARDTTSSTAENLRPGSGTAFGLRLEHSLGRARLALQATYAKTGIAATAPGLTLTDKTFGRLYELGMLVNYRVGAVGSSGALRAELGPALHLWKLDDDYRARVGALGSMAYEWPVTAGLTGIIRVEGTVSNSWFDAVDLPPEVERQATWRYGWGVGLRYRL